MANFPTDADVAAGMRGLHEKMCGSPPSCGMTDVRACHEAGIHPDEVRVVLQAVADARKTKPHNVITITGQWCPNCGVKIS